MTDFIKKVEQAKYLIASFTRDPTPGRTPYTSHRYESYLSYPAYTKRSHNSQPFQRRDDKAHDVRFPSYIHKKNADNKGKGIDRINQSKLWETGKDINKDVCIYIIYSDDEDSHTSQPSSSTHSQTSANKVYFVRDSIQSFNSKHCKFGYNKTFRSLEAKAIYENNKTYIKTVKLKARQYTQTIINCIYHIYSVEFSLQNELFKYLNNRYIGA